VAPVAPATLEEKQTPSRIIVVLDSGAAMKPYETAIRQALQSVEGRVTMILADQAEDRAWARTVARRKGAAIKPGAEPSDRAADAMPLEADRPLVADRWTDWTCRGGVDNSYALVEAFSWVSRSSEAKHGPVSVVWLHGPQPLPVSPSSELHQVWERHFHEPRLIDVSVVPAPNHLLTSLSRPSRWYHGPRSGGPEFATALTDMFTSLPDFPSRRPVTYERAPATATPPPEGIEVWDQQARYAVFSQVMAAQQGRGEAPLALKKSAADHQLVTPETGAVVLENAQQFKDAGLAQVDPTATPKIPIAPEPGTALLLGAGALLLTRRRRRALGCRS
jgi:hypothetical protein